MRRIYGGGGDGEVDTVDCGPGIDAVKKSPAGQLDRLLGCETSKRSVSSRPRKRGRPDFGTAP